MELKLLQVDAFTDKPFSGNPAAVFILDGPREDRWMQNVATEMNLSETAFLTDEGTQFRLRWFTPLKEVTLCGHATLASAHILWETGILPLDKIARFETRSGLLTARHKDDWIELDFPKEPETSITAPPDLQRALGATPSYVGKNRFDILVEIDSESVLRAIEPDFALLETLSMRGVIVTSRASSPQFDFISRFFAPGSGINEDPVTGSSHCCLGPFWQKRLGKDQFVAYQASERGGVVRVRVAENRVFLSGQAVTVFSGKWFA